MTPTPEWLRPTRQQADREAGEEWLATTYDRRFAEFCHRTGLDPEDTNSVLEFEKEETEQPDE